MTKHTKRTLLRKSKSKRNKLRKNKSRKNYKSKLDGGGIYKVEYEFIPKNMDDFTQKIQEAYQIINKIDKLSTIETQFKNQMEKNKHYNDTEIKHFEELINKNEITDEEKDEIKQMLTQIAFDEMNTKIHQIIINKNLKNPDEIIYKTTDYRFRIMELEQEIITKNNQFNKIMNDLEKLNVNQYSTKLYKNKKLEFDELDKQLNELEPKLKMLKNVYDRYIKENNVNINELPDFFSKNPEVKTEKEKYTTKISEIKNSEISKLIQELKTKITNIKNNNESNNMNNTKIKDMELTNQTSHTVWFYKDYNKDEIKNQLRNNDAKALFANLSDVNKSIIKIPTTFYNTNGNKQINIYNTLSSGLQKQNIKFLDYDIPLSECNIRISLDVSYVRDKLTNIKDNTLSSDSIFIPPEYKKTYGNLNTVNPSIDNVVPTKNSTSDTKVIQVNS